MKRILLLHTGGTLGMKGSPLEPGEFAERLVEFVPEVQKIASIDTKVVVNLDSSDVGPEHWAILADEIAATHDDYDGFVVIHGTDTMAYCASALSFALKNLAKPVVFTGAQRPLSALRTDARRNLADAVDLATRDIPEVGICFDGLLLRGCRTTKTSASDYRGFESPASAPLARLGVNVNISKHIRHPDGDFSCDSRFDPNVLYVQITPGMSPYVLRQVLDAPGLNGVVISAFGVGTIPTTFRPLGPVIGDAVARGLGVVVVTPSTGKVNFGLYKNGHPLRDAGAIPGGDMHLEAAVTKLMHGLAIADNLDELREYIETDIAGELG